MVQFHTGSLAGMVAIVGMIPEENIGVYVMGNLDHVELRHAIMYSVCTSGCPHNTALDLMCIISDLTHVLESVSALMGHMY